MALTGLVGAFPLTEENNATRNDYPANTANVIFTLLSRKEILHWSGSRGMGQQRNQG